MTTVEYSSPVQDPQVLLTQNVPVQKSVNIVKEVIEDLYAGPGASKLGGGGGYPPDGATIILNGSSQLQLNPNNVQVFTMQQTVPALFLDSNTDIDNYWNNGTGLFGGANGGTQPSVKGTTNNIGGRIFNVFSDNGAVLFTVYDSGQVTTWNYNAQTVRNTLDDGAGNATFGDNTTNVVVSVSGLLNVRDTANQIPQINFTDPVGNAAYGTIYALNFGGSNRGLDIYGGDLPKHGQVQIMSGTLVCGKADGSANADAYVATSNNTLDDGLGSATFTNFTNFKMSSGAGAGLVLSSNAAGNGTWAALLSNAITLTSTDSSITLTQVGSNIDLALNLSASHKWVGVQHLPSGSDVYSTNSGIEFTETEGSGAVNGVIINDVNGFGNSDSTLKIQGDDTATNYLQFGDGAGNLNSIRTTNNVIDDGAGNLATAGSVSPGSNGTQGLPIHFFSGDGVPSSLTGMITGDLYFRTDSSTARIYRYSGSAWGVIL